MNSKFPRRGFLTGAAAVAAFSCLSLKPSTARELLYPPVDLSYFDTPIPPGPSEIHYGYAAITWGGNDPQAIDHVSAPGFRGIQLPSNSVDESSNIQP